MNIAKLISILQTLPMDTVIQIGYYADAYEEKRIENVTSITFQEKHTSEKFPQCNRPNRVTLS